MTAPKCRFCVREAIFTHHIESAQPEQYVIWGSWGGKIQNNNDILSLQFTKLSNGGSMLEKRHREADMTPEHNVRKSIRHASAQKFLYF